METRRNERNDDDLIMNVLHRYLRAQAWYRKFVRALSYLADFPLPLKSGVVPRHPGFTVSSTHLRSSRTEQNTLINRQLPFSLSTFFHSFFFTVIVTMSQCIFPVSPLSALQFIRAGSRETERLFKLR